MKPVSAIFLFLAGAGVAFALLSPRYLPAVNAVHPARGTAVEAVYATGTVEPTVMLPVAPRLTGRLLGIEADEGSRVSKGQVLGQLEDADLRKTLDENRSRQVLTEKEYERKSALAKKGYETKSSLDKARADMEAARAAVARTETQIGYLQLLAPDDGEVIRRDGEIGQVIPANQPVFWLSCCAGLRISADVDEEDIARVVPGQKVLIRADAFPGATFNGTVTAVTPKGDPVSRSYRVRIGLSEGHTLRIGMTAESNIIIAEKADALLVPNTAVTGDTVWVVEKGALQKKTVTVGVRGSDKTEILSGVTEQDLVVTDNPKDFDAGRKVRARTP